MTTKKKSAGKKAAKTASKDATTRANVEVFTADELTHSPIIITDGSLSIEFDGREYIHPGSGHHVSLGLRLDKVDVATNAGGHTCIEFTGSDIHRIVALAMIGGVEAEIAIVGAKEPSLALLSPALDFARDTKFIEDSVNFPPMGRFGRRFANRNATIKKFTIKNLRTDEVVHDCPFVTTAGFKYTIVDGHQF